MPLKIDWICGMYGPHIAQNKNEKQYERTCVPVKKNTIIRTTLIFKRKKVFKNNINNINCMNTRIKILKISKI